MRLSSLLGNSQKQEKQYTSSGTFTVPTGVTEVLATLVGGGGSGAAIVNYTAGSGDECHASGASAAMTIFKLPIKIGDATTLHVTVGAGGAGVTVTDSSDSLSGVSHNGNNGGNSSIQEPYSGGYYTAYGGKAGLADASLSGIAGGHQTYTEFPPYAILGGNGGAASSSGGNGQSGSIVSGGGGEGRSYSSVCNAGGGGASIFGHGGNAAAGVDSSVTSSQSAMDGYGGGSGGAAGRRNGTVTATSADGKNGIVIIEWEGLPYGS